MPDPAGGCAGAAPIPACGVPAEEVDEVDSVRPTAGLLPGYGAAAAPPPVLPVDGAVPNTELRPGIDAPAAAADEPVEL